RLEGREPGREDEAEPVGSLMPHAPSRRLLAYGFLRAQSRARGKSSTQFEARRWPRAARSRANSERPLCEEYRQRARIPARGRPPVPSRAGSRLSLVVGCPVERTTARLER